MTVKHSDLGFWCRYCESVQYVSTFSYAETDDFYEYRLVCPNCGKHLVLRQQSVMAYIRNLKNGST